MGKAKELLYGVADKAWQPIVGCDPHMPCAPRCWARRTVARVVECQRNVPSCMASGRDKFFEIALTPDLKQWSGEVRIDEEHLNDPLKWRKPAVVATGFHGDWLRLGIDQSQVLAVMKACPQHTFLSLTKQPQWFIGSVAALANVSIGVSVMNQPEADKMRPYVEMIARCGWRTHVWHEPALGAVDWRGWEFLEGMVTGGESGTDSRPMHPDWARQDRDWCRTHGIAFTFKQWGNWIEHIGLPIPADNGIVGPKFHEWPNGKWSQMVGKRAAGCLLDGREWKEFPRRKA